MPENNEPNPADLQPELAGAIAEIAERSQRLVDQYVARQAEAHPGYFEDNLGLGKAFMDLAAHLMSNPQLLMKAQFDMWHGYMNLWHHTTRRMLGMDSNPVAIPEADDRRFRHEQWEDNPVLDFVKQSYLVAAGSVQQMVSEVEGLDDKTNQKIAFYTRQFVDAMAPTNFAMTNPEVLEETIKTNGQNLLKGLNNMLQDLEKGDGQLRITMTDQDAFELGRNVAVTPGKVVFQTDMMQLIQYEPTTEEVYKRPLLIIPPWINKYYILDLQPKNSFIKWAVDQGHTVFVISWVNPDERHRDKGFEDYMLEGPLAALDAIEQATGETSANVIGYCLGGTLLSATLSYLEQKKKKAIASATFFVTLIDFAEPGDLGVFIDEEQLAALERTMNERGYLEGAEMATTFNMLRANDLIWSFVVNNYLMGKDPFPFDLLYWNSDSTRMPAKMHSFYLRKMYLENVFKDCGGVALDGVDIDVSAIQTPAYFISTREDHIAPWKATYAGARLFSGPVQFTLGMSGHIAGIVNPPASGKYGYWTGESVEPETPDAWLEQAEEHAGSWWPHWAEWIDGFGDGKAPARVPGDRELTVVEPAPGSFARVRASAPAEPKKSNGAG